MRPTLIAFLLAGIAAAQGVKFESTTQLVVVNVAAKTKSGEPLENLKASDFTVTEDGKAQQIKVFEFQRLEDAVQPVAAAASTASQALAVRTAASPLKQNVTIAPSKPGEIKYKDRRLLVLFFDLSGMSVAEQIRAQKSAQKFLATSMTQSDMVAIMTFGTDLKVLQDFTDDRDALSKVIRSLTAGDTGTANGCTGDDSEVDTGAAYTQDDSEFNIFNTDRKLAALESAVKMLASLAEKKALVYFASGMTLNGIDNQAQLARHGQRCHSRQRGVLSRGRARPGGHGAARRCHARLAGRPGHVLRQLAAHHAGELPGAAGDALLAGHRYRRQGAARPERSFAGDSCRRRRISRAITSWATTAPIPRATGTTAASRCRSTRT